MLLLCAVLSYQMAVLSQPLTDGKPFPETARPFESGEVLRYKVKWHFIRLGTLLLTQQLVDSLGSSNFLVSLHGESAKGLPLIDVLFHVQSVLLPDDVASRHFTRDTGEKEKSLLIYHYDAESKYIVKKEWENGRLIEFDSTAYDGLYYDAVGVFMIIRCLAGSGRTVALPTIMHGKVERTRLEFREDVEEIEVEAVDHPLRARRVDGKAEWVNESAAGMKGSFRGWISDDEAAIPLRAELEISLGSITLELESFTRAAWPVKQTAQNILRN
jgi:hypothetical protein